MQPLVLNPQSIPSDVIERLGYYVYAYVDRKTESIIYVGKGKGERMLAHLLRFSAHRVDILSHGIPDEKTAYLVEAAVIDAFGLPSLSNRVRGKHSAVVGRIPLREIVLKYAAHPAKIRVPALLIRINRLFRSDMSSAELYDATRGVWRLGKRRESAQYAMAIYNGLVREVFAIHTWHEAGTTEYRFRKQSELKLKGRCEFTGKLASNEVRQEYFGKSVTHLMSVGAQNPVTYAG